MARKDKKEEDVEEEEEDVALELIVEKRIRRGKASYLCKWEGLPELDNTWETEEDLREDGYDKIIEKFEMEMVETSRPGRKKSPRRSRSKTPVKSPSKKSPKKKSNNTVSDLETTDDEQEKEERSRSDSQQGIPESYASVKVIDEFWSAWTVLCVLSFIGTIVWHMYRTIEGSKKLGMMKVFNLMPCSVPLLCLLGIFRRASPTDFANTACAIELWIAVVAFFEEIPNIVEKSNDDSIFDPETLVVFSMMVWQFCLFVAVSSSAVEFSGSDSRWNSFIVLAIPVVFSIYYVDTHVAQFSKLEYAVVFFALISFLRATLNVINSRHANFGLWLELGSTFLCASIIASKLFHKNKTDLRGFVMASGEIIEYDTIWVQDHVMRMISATLILASAVLYH